MGVTRSGSRNGQCRFLGPLCVFVGVLLLLSRPAPADVYTEWDRLAAEGAWSLAADILAAAQPAHDADPAAWEAWEQRHIKVLSSAEQWPELLARVAQHPAQLSPSFQAWAQTRAAEAELALHQPAAARARLQRLIWTTPRELADAQLPGWQRLVLRSYLEEGLIDDAYTALQRYRHEYDPAADTATLLLAMHILLRAERGAEALPDLEKSSDPLVRAWQVWVALHSDVLGAAAAAEKATRLAHAPDPPPIARHRAWLTVAEAAARLGDETQRLAALEQAVAWGDPQEEGDPRSEPSFVASVDALWEAYMNYGRVLAERARLDVADTQAWFDTAALLREQKPLEARAVLARLAWEGADPAYTPLAHQQFTALLRAAPAGDVLLKALYLHTSRFLTLAAVPAIVRYRLVDQALEQGDATLAARLLADLTQPPPGTDAVSWQLQQARVALRAGAVETAMQGLAPLLDAPEALDPANRERLLDMALDLQAVQEHDAALILLRAIANWDGEQDAHDARDVSADAGLVWFAVGESLRGRSEFAEAARAYLRAAQASSADSWGDIARERAVGALIDAGYPDDARRVYQQLLARSDDPSRFMLLRQRLDHVQVRSATGQP